MEAMTPPERLQDVTLAERLQRAAESGDSDRGTSELLAEAAAALSVRGWLPIESAPKDGKLFLCWVDAVRYAESDEGQPYQVDVSECDFGRWQDSEHGGYYENMMGQIGDGQIISHWQPLPTPPSEG